MCRIRILTRLAIVFAGLMFSTQVSAKQIALLIGNQSYGTELGQLEKPISDTSAIAASLEKIGFVKEDIHVVVDAKRSEILSAVAKYAAELKDSGPNAVGFFYYAGHGIANSLSRINHLIPVDMRSLDQGFWDGAVALNSIIHTLLTEAGNASHFVIFDACHKLHSLPVNAGNGCLPLSIRDGMLIAMASPAGQFVSNPSHEHGRFGAILAEELRKPATDHATLFESISAAAIRYGSPSAPWVGDGMIMRVVLDTRHARRSGKPSGESKVATGNGKLDVAVGLKAGEEFRDCLVCPSMVVAPAGKFMLGSTDAEHGHTKTEGPQTEVRFAKPFAIGKFEVTFDEWEVCVAEGGCRRAPEDEGWGRRNRPVIDVSWIEITNEYLPWLTKKTGHEYRLPSETEWEYAARAGSTTPFWWGSKITAQNANYDANHVYKGGGNKGPYRGRTSFVDTFTPNPWGLYNVHGNVWEWTADCWNPSHAGNPADGSARTTGICNRRVVRGGALFLKPEALRSAYRNWLSADIHYNDYGFRVARSIKQ